LYGFISQTSEESLNTVSFIKSVFAFNSSSDIYLVFASFSVFSKSFNSQADAKTDFNPNLEYSAFFNSSDDGI
jgi:hypothetical protein